MEELHTAGAISNSRPSTPSASPAGVSGPQAKNLPAIRTGKLWVAVGGSEKALKALSVAFRAFSELAAGEGFEPSHTESESAVLPLHNPAKFITNS